MKEYFSELFISNLGKKLGFNMASYEYQDGFIRTLNFTNNNSVNFEPIFSIVGDNDDYEVSFNALKNISNDIAKDYLKMIYLDSICYNMDRHTFNYGLLRDVESGNIISLAPQFDYNIALISRGMPSDIKRDNDGILKFFYDFIENNDEALKMFKNLNIIDINDKMTEDTFNLIPDIILNNINIDLNTIKEFILNGKLKINKFINNI